MDSWAFLRYSPLKQGFASTLTTHAVFYLLPLLSLFWLLLNLLYWSFPGGPAWGKHHLLMGNCNRWWRPSIPGPRGLPFLGSMSLMVGLAHRHLARTAELLHAERLMAFSLGDTRVVVTANHEIAKEILGSAAFADRPLKELAYSLMFHRAIGFAPYGVYWRTLRRIAATHLFSPRQIRTSEQQRFTIAAEMVAALREKEHAPVVLRDVVKQASLSHMMSLVFGRRYGVGWKENPELNHLRTLVDEGYDLLGKLDWGDHLPILSFLDLHKIRLRCSTLVPKVKQFVGNIVEEHRAILREGKLGPSGTSPPSDFVDVLLSLEPPERLADEDMIAVLWEMIFRGTDTVAVVVEWVMARMVVHVDVQGRVQKEMDDVVGRSREVAEGDVEGGLPFLQAVLKEALRLHPPGPLLSWARRANRDAVVDGRHVPAGTTAMVNMWAITHDPNVWDDPHEFRPDRFLGGEEEPWEGFSVMGSDLRLAPFGSGRRICPGKVLGMATVGFWVATLLHEYAWRAPIADGGGLRAEVDFSESLRLSCEMKTPLTVELRNRRRAS